MNVVDAGVARGLEIPHMPVQLAARNERKIGEDKDAFLEFDKLFGGIE